jgi:4-aminobutyrate aminotransferase-like enzyme
VDAGVVTPALVIGAWSHTGFPANEAAERTMYECLARGLSFKVGQGNVLTLGPPLVITYRQLEQAFDILDAALAVVEARMHVAPIPPEEQQ